MAIGHAGYRGILDLDGAGTYLRFNDCSISAKQGVEIPDMVMGDWDHDVYAYGKVEVNGSISGLVDESFGDTIWNWGFIRDDCGLLTPKSPHLYYYCDSGTGRDISFTNLYVNSLNFTCAAGDVANWSVDVVGKEASDFGTTSAPHFTTTNKLITWDKVGVSITPGTDLSTLSAVAFQNLEFTVANNVEPVYAITSTSEVPENRLFPYNVVPGIRTITGSLTAIDIDDALTGFKNWDAYTTGGQSTMVFNIGGLAVTFLVRFHRLDPKMSSGLITSTVAFSGVSHQS